MTSIPGSNRRERKLLLISLLLIVAAGTAFGQTSSFTYQGRLTDGGTPANGSYDLQFTLFEAAAGSGLPIGSTITRSAVAVAGGVFTVQLDFGASAFPGADRFLEIATRQHSADPNTPPYTTLSPRQQITSTPYAVRSGNTTLADAATNAIQLGGVPADQYVQTNDSRLSDPRPPTTGSSNYIQNGTSQQAASNFNISGAGTAGGTLSGNMVNATTQYNLNGNRVLTSVGTENLFVGLSAGTSHTTGVYNSFFGTLAGNANTSGVDNSFFGDSAGQSNTTKGDNSFFGAGSGFNNVGGASNTFLGALSGLGNTSGGSNSFAGAYAGLQNTTGNQNAFFGVYAGQNNFDASGNVFVGYASGMSNQSGGNNTIIGANANVGSSNLNNATAIGANAVVSASNTVVLGTNAVTVQVPGNLNVSGAFTGIVPAIFISGVVAQASGGTGLSSSGASGNVLRSNGSSWTSSPLSLSDIPDLGGSYIKNTNAPQANSNFNISGDGTVGGTLSAGAVNATSQYKIGGNRVLSVAGAFTPNSDTFAGVGAGAATTPSGGNLDGNLNSFFGYLAGNANTTGCCNSLFGSQAGLHNTSGFSNAFFGVNAGNKNETGTNNSFFGDGVGFNSTANSNNSFFGYHAGFNNLADGNSFFGAGAGAANTTGLQNAFFGAAAGVVNHGGLSNAFFGVNAGGGNTEGNFNAFFGLNAGLGNLTGEGNTFIGLAAGQSNISGTDNTAIGVGANVGSGNLTNATAIGASAVVSTSNTIVLGRSNGSDTVRIPGSLVVTGSISKGGGSFRIDHPLDPKGMYLYHSFVESPDMMNIYNGNVTTDAKGEAVVSLPDYFGALNRDFRYQLTVINQFAQAIVAEKVNNNRFKIRTDKPNVEVSWQVTGIRQDPYANAHRIQVEQPKAENERGTYLYPDLYEQRGEEQVNQAQQASRLVKTPQP